MKLRGGDQTDDGKAANLHLVARRGATELAAERGLLGRGLPVGDRLHVLLAHAAGGGQRRQGLGRPLRPSPSRPTPACAATSTGRRSPRACFVKSATGLFKGAENRHSGLQDDDREAARPPRHRHGRRHRRGADRGDQEGRREQVEAGREPALPLLVPPHGDRRGQGEGAEGADLGLQDPAPHLTAEGKYFMNVTKAGLANNDVAAGSGRRRDGEGGRDQGLRPVMPA